MHIEQGKFLETILSQKRQEVAEMADEKVRKVRKTYKLYDFLREQREYLQVIAECKKASPSLGDINVDADLTQQARAYEMAGAAMISVLTDPVFFKGNIDYLREISSVVAVPTLCKDFIIDKKQIKRAVNAGATVILLIVACFEDNFEKLRDLYEYALSLGLEVLVETHNRGELDRAHALGAKIIGVNNRNLKTFEVSLRNSLDLVQYFKPENVYISESGIFGSEEVKQIGPYFDAVLVGTALMQSEDVEKSLTELQVKK